MPPAAEVEQGEEGEGPLLGTITNGIVILGVTALLVITLVSWIGEGRGPTGPAAGPGTWLLALPVQMKAIVLFLSLPLAVWLTVRLWAPLPLGVPRSVDSALRLTGLVLFTAGEVLTIWGRTALGRMWTLSTSFGVRLHEEHRLVRNGPFAIVRHPMYLGLCALLVGIVLLYRTWGRGPRSTLLARGLPAPRPSGGAHARGSVWGRMARLCAARADVDPEMAAPSLTTQRQRPNQ